MLLTQHSLNEQLMTLTFVSGLPSQTDFSQNQKSLFTETQLRQKLYIARQKLMETDTPLLLKISYYLRISCSVMQKLYQQQKTDYQEITYTNLIKLLFSYDSEWWKKCIITATGELKSDDYVINELLYPIAKFHLIETAFKEHS